MTTVINLRDEAAVKRARADGTFVRVDRKTVFGNPFVIGKDGDREQVLARYREWIVGQRELIARLPELRGKSLACWCVPEPTSAVEPTVCHGQILMALIALLPVSQGALWSIAEAPFIVNDVLPYEPWPGYTMTKEEAVEKARREGGNLFYAVDAQKARPPHEPGY